MNNGGFKLEDMYIPSSDVTDQPGVQPKPLVAQQLIDEKHREYLRKSYFYRISNQGGLI